MTSCIVCLAVTRELIIVTCRFIAGSAKSGPIHTNIPQESWYAVILIKRFLLSDMILRCSLFRGKGMCNHLLSFISSVILTVF